MKWIYSIQQKSKTALLLLGIVATILGGNYLEKKLFTDIHRSVSSIYNDRLIPAAELFLANDIMYKKRLALEKYLINPAGQDVITLKRVLTAYNNQIDSVVQAYEATYLVDEESTSLHHFKQSVNQYNKLELVYVTQPGELSADAYDKRMGPLFSEIHQDLVQLSRIQTSVGKDLLNGSKTISNGANLIGNLQIAIVVIIMLVVYTFLLSTRSLIPKNLNDLGLN